MNNIENIINIKILSKISNLNDKDVIKSIKLYSLIRELYRRNTDILKNDEFMWAFCSYYGLSFHYRRTDLIQYFSVMQKYIDNNSPMNIENIVKELNTSKKHYVFASKLMNFVDDNKYPIIDSKVSNLFGFKRSDRPTTRYMIIEQTYQELLKNSYIKEIINKYDFNNIGIMKIIDIIIWNLI